MKVAKTFLVFFLSFIFLISTSSAYASLVTINEEGRIVINVLSAEESLELEIPRGEYLEVKNIVSATPDPEAKITLSKDGGKVKLNVSTASGDKSLDVTSYKDEIVEVEERPQAEKLVIGVRDGKFTIAQRDVIAITDYDINIDPQDARLMLETPSGLAYLSILPRQAVNSVLRSKTINRIGGDGALSIIETDRELSYEVAGDKVINVFNLIEYPVPVKVNVSASTGEILSVDQPTWLRVIRFLLD